MCNSEQQIFFKIQRTRGRTTVTPAGTSFTNHKVKINQNSSIRKRQNTIKKRYSRQQKQTIKTIMGGTIEWDGVQFVLLKDTIVTKPSEAKGEVFKNYKNKTTSEEEPTPVEKPVGFDEIYEPDQELNEKMWENLLDPITNNETLDILIWKSTRSKAVMRNLFKM